MVKQYSLRHLTKKIINNKYPDLALEADKKLEFVEFFNKNSSWITGAFILAFFIICSCIPLQFIKCETAQKLLDQRTSNLATIISMALAVIGFLLTNLANKDAFNYKLLFSRTQFLPRIFYVSWTIVLLIAISAIQDILPSDIFIRLVQGGTILVMLAIPVVIDLFRKLIDFTDPSKINDYVDSGVLQEIHSEIVTELYQRHSSTYFRNWLKQKGITSDISPLITIKPGEFEINDINLKLLADYLSDKTDLYFNFYIGEKVSFPLGYYSQREARIEEEVQKALIIKKQKFYNSTLQLQFSDYFKKKFNKSILNADFSLILQSLKSSESFIKYSLKYDSQNQMALITYYYQFYNSSISSIQNNKSIHLSSIIDIVDNVLQESLSKDSPKYFSFFISILGNVYKIGSTKITPSIETEDIIQNSFLLTKRILSIILTRTLYFDVMKGDNKISSRKEYYYHSFISLSVFFRQAISLNNSRHFIQLIDILNDFNSTDREYKKIIPSNPSYLNRVSSNVEFKTFVDEEFLKENPVNYERHLIILIRYWLYWQYQNTWIGFDLLSEFLQELGDCYAHESDILFFKKESKYFNRGEWDRSQMKNNKFGGDSNWFFFGFIIDKLRYKDFSFNDICLHLGNTNEEIIFYKERLSDILQNNFDKIRNNITQWENILPNDLEEAFDRFQTEWENSTKH